MDQIITSKKLKLKNNYHFYLIITWYLTDHQRSWSTDWSMSRLIVSALKCLHFHLIFFDIHKYWSALILWNSHGDQRSEWDAWMDRGFAPLAGLGRLFASSSLFIRCGKKMLQRWGRSWFGKPPDRRGAAPGPRSDNRWAVTLSSTSRWYSNLLHFPRERTPQWEHITALQASPQPPPSLPPPAGLWSFQCGADRSWGSVTSGGDGRRAGLHVEASLSEATEAVAEGLS